MPEMFLTSLQFWELITNAQKSSIAEMTDLYLFKSFLDNLLHSIKVFILAVSLTNLLIQINCTKPKSFIKTPHRWKFIRQQNTLNKSSPPNYKISPLKAYWIISQPSYPNKSSQPKNANKIQRHNNELILWTNEI